LFHFFLFQFAAKTVTATDPRDIRIIETTPSGENIEASDLVIKNSSEKYLFNRASIFFIALRVYKVILTTLALA
jgi:hypothetical protein